MEALANMITLALPDPTKTFTLFPDASHRSWGSVLTQIDPASAGLPASEQDHQPLAFLSGAFKGASLRWSTTEKEAYAIVASCKRLDYLLQRPGGFTICTDHRNLRYIFGQEPELKPPRYLADKLTRWAMILDTFTYDIRHIPGEANVWGGPPLQVGQSRSTVGLGRSGRRGSGLGRRTASRHEATCPSPATHAIPSGRRLRMAIVG
jgi:hypothetical protein